MQTYELQVSLYRREIALKIPFAFARILERTHPDLSYPIFLFPLNNLCVFIENVLLLFGLFGRSMCIQQLSDGLFSDVE
jgi:hypothetical protein